MNLPTQPSTILNSKRQLLQFTGEVDIDDRRSGWHSKSCRCEVQDPLDAPCEDSRCNMAGLFTRNRQNRQFWFCGRQHFFQIRQRTNGRAADFVTVLCRIGVESRRQRKTKAFEPAVAKQRVAQ